MYLFFDTETTGLPKSWKAPVTDLNNWPRVVQLAWLLFDGAGNKLSGKDFIIKPDGFSISQNAANIHGITTERANLDGINISIVLQEFQTVVSQAEFLVAHNMSFDEMVLGAEFLRNRMPNCISSKKKICTMKSTINFCAIKNNYGYKYPGLSELYFKLFNSKFAEAHNAAMDITATAKCFWELKRLKII